MSYGSGAYGSLAYGGGSNAANEQAFFALLNRAPDTLFEASALFTGPEAWYEILTRQGSEPGSGPAGVEYRFYTSDGPGLTPQPQGGIGGNGQTIIPAAPIIVVTAIIDSAVWGVGTDFSVRGRPYTQ